MASLADALATLEAGLKAKYARLEKKEKARISRPNPNLAKLKAKKAASSLSARERALAILKRDPKSKIGGGIGVKAKLGTKRPLSKKSHSSSQALKKKRIRSRANIPSRNIAKIHKSTPTVPPPKSTKTIDSVASFDNTYDEKKIDKKTSENIRKVDNDSIPGVSLPQTNEMKTLFEPEPVNIDPNQLQIIDSKKPDTVVTMSSNSDQPLSSSRSIPVKQGKHTVNAEERTLSSGSNGPPRKRLRKKDLYPEVSYVRNVFGYQVTQYVEPNPVQDPMFPLGPVRDVQTRKRIHRSNYHLRQNQQNRLDIRTYTQNDRELRDSAPRQRYRRRNLEFKSVNHWTQRQIVVQEIEFLLQHSRQGDYVVYIGAAPGTQIPYLSELFPWLTFHLYDTSEIRCHSNELIKIHNVDFNNEILRDWRDCAENVLLLFNLKQPRGQDSSDKPLLSEGMETQRDIYLRLRPRKALLRFRLPWGKGVTRFLDGKLLLPVWGKQTTTEALLIPDADGKEKEYDHIQFEERMFYFNTVRRVQYYRHSVVGVRGLDHCYDCASEVFIMGKYLEKHFNVFTAQWEYNERGREVVDKISGPPTEEMIRNKIPLFIQQISKVSSATADRELYFNQPPSMVRAKWYSSRHNSNMQNESKNKGGDQKISSEM